MLMLFSLIFIGNTGNAIKRSVKKFIKNEIGNFGISFTHTQTHQNAEREILREKILKYTNICRSVFKVSNYSNHLLSILKCSLYY